MNECLVTKLRASINDDSLSRLGGFTFKMKDINTTLNQGYVRILFEVPTDVIVQIINDGYFYKPNSTEIDYTVGKTKSFTSVKTLDLHIAPSSKVCVRPRYNINYILATGIEIDLSEFTYMPELNLVRLGNETIVSGNTEVFRNYTKLSELNIPLTAITGKVTDFGKLTNLTILNISNTKVSGSLEEFVAAQIQNGRTEATIGFYYPGYTNLTYKGAPLKGMSLSSNDNTSKLSWTSDGVITLT